MNRRIELGDRVEQVERADDVVHLGVDGVRPVDHRIRRAALFGEVDDRVRLERTDRLVQERIVVQVPDKRGDGVPADFLPGRDTPVELADRDEGVRAHLLVVVTADEVVDDPNIVTALGKVECGWPSEVAVPP